MSNPAVITLDNASSKKGKLKRFVLEDNIGESIHLHIENMRLDFTIKEFLEFSKMISESLIELDFLGGYSIGDFDEHFLKKCTGFFPNLKKIAIEEIELSKLKCIVHSNYRSDLNLIKLSSISDIPAYKYLKGDKQEFLNYRQYNYFNMSNEKRLLQTLESIEKNDYPYKDKYIVLFNGQDIIREGQHRAAILAHLNGLDSHIKIMRFYFNGKSHYIKQHINNTGIVIKWFIRKTYRKLKNIIKK